MKSCLLALLAPISLLFCPISHLRALRCSRGGASRSTSETSGHQGTVRPKTQPIQHALDRCSVLGGCEVLVPPGEYLTGAALKGISLAHVRGAKLRDIKVKGYTGPLIGIHNVTGSGLKGAAAIPAPQLPEPVPAPVRPYRLR